MKNKPNNTQKPRFEFVPSYRTSSTGVLSEISEDSSSTSHLPISVEDARGLYEMLEQASFSGRPNSFEPLELDPPVILQRPSEISSHAGTRQKVMTWLNGFYQKSRADSDAVQFESRVLTVLQVDSFETRESLQAALVNRFPGSIKFSLRRCLVQPKFRRSASGSASIFVYTSHLSRVDFVLTHSERKGHADQFRLFYSSTLSSVTDSVSAKYLTIEDSGLALATLAEMFVFPLRELFRLSQATRRHRQEGARIREREVLLTNRRPISGTKPFGWINWEAWSHQTLEERVRSPFFSKIQVASLIVSTRMSLRELELPEELDLHKALRSLLSCIDSIYTTAYRCAGGVKFENSRDTRSMKASFSPTPGSQETDMLVPQLLDTVKLEILAPHQDNKKLYELHFSSFDPNKVRRELSMTKDVQAFYENVKDNSEFGASDEPRRSTLDSIEQSVSHSLELQLLMTRRSLSIDPSNPAKYEAGFRSTASRLLSFIADSGGMHCAFLPDFQYAWDRANLSYWLNPTRWGRALESREALLQTLNEVKDLGPDLPSHYQFETGTYDLIMDVCRFMAESKEPNDSRLQRLQYLFPLEDVVVGRKNTRRNRVRRTPELAALTFTYMALNPDLNLLAALEKAPFLSDSVKEAFQLKNWEYKTSRSRTEWTNEVSSFMKDHFGFNPSYNVGLHREIRRQFIHSFLNEGFLPMNEAGEVDYQAVTKRSLARGNPVMLTLLPSLQRGVRRMVRSGE